MTLSCALVGDGLAALDNLERFFEQLGARVVKRNTVSMTAVLHHPDGPSCRLKVVARGKCSFDVVEFERRPGMS